MRQNNLLSSLEGQGKVVTSVLRLEPIKVEGIRVEPVDQGTKGKSIIPAGAEVLNLYLLETSTKGELRTIGASDERKPHCLVSEISVKVETDVLEASERERER